MGGIFAVCLSEACCAAGEVLQVCAVSGDQEGSANTPPEAEETSDDAAVAPDAAVSLAGCRSGSTGCMAGPHRMDSALRSLGWMLPLRI